MQRFAVMLLSFLSAVVLSHPAAGIARARTYHPTFCYRPTTDASSAVVDGSSREIENQTGSTLEVQCPISSDTYLYQGDVTNTDVWVSNQHSGVYIQAAVCVAYIDASGGTCSTYAQDNTTGYHALHPSPTVWGTPGGWGYIDVKLPSASGSNYSRINGYNTSNTAP